MKLFPEHSTVKTGIAEAETGEQVPDGIRTEWQVIACDLFSKQSAALTSYLSPYTNYRSSPAVLSTGMGQESEGDDRNTEPAEEGL